MGGRVRGSTAKHHSFPWWVSRYVQRLYTPHRGETLRSMHVLARPYCPGEVGDCVPPPGGTRVGGPRATQQQRAAQRRYNATHAEQYRAYHQRYYATHAEQQRVYQRRYRATHAEQVRAVQQRYYATHAEQRRAAQRRYRATHAEQVRAVQQRYYATHKPASKE